MDRVTLDKETRVALTEVYLRDYMHQDASEAEYNGVDKLKLFALFEHPAISDIAIKITGFDSDEDLELPSEIPETLTLKWQPKTSFKTSCQLHDVFGKCSLKYVDGNKWESKENCQMIAYSCEWEEVEDARRLVILLLRAGAEVVVEAMTADKNDKIYEPLPDDVTGMLLHFFAIVQYGLYNRPTVVSERREVTNIPARKSKYGKNKKRAKRIVEVVRHISFGEVEHKAGTHTMVCPAWGVMGHYRHYKDGKVVWIKPYTKGKMRDVLDKYEDKEYKFRKVEEGAYEWQLK